MRGITFVAYLFFSILLIFTTVQVFRFHNWDMFLWGATVRYFIMLIGCLCVSCAGILIADRYFKNKTCRKISVAFIAIMLIALLLRYIYIFRINNLGEESLREFYPNLIYMRALPAYFHLTVCLSLILLLIVLNSRLRKQITI